MGTACDEHAHAPSDRDAPTVEFVERNSRTWIPAPGDPDETDRVIRAVASGDLSEGDFRDWTARRG
jgi:hypothetical protein